MSDKELMVLSTLEDIIYSIQLIKKRFKNINCSDEFLIDEDGLDKLDSISMRLIAIGEAFKNIDKLTHKKLLSRYTTIDWRGVKGVRDILSHHYFQLDAETIYNICNDYIDELVEVSIQMTNDIKDGVIDVL